MLHNLWNFLTSSRGSFYDAKERHNYLLEHELKKSQIQCLTHL